LGLGKDVRFLASHTCGAAPWAQEGYVHICAFANDGNSDFSTGVSRPSQRRWF
jgi:hypothetical protein